MQLIRLGATALVCLVWSGCAADTTDPRGSTGSTVAVNIAPLQLANVSDACWDIEVRNGSGETVFTKRVTSRQYGDGQGDASYVGPCDGSQGEAANVVYLDLVGIYDGAATCAPAFVAGDDLDGGSQPFNDGFGVLSRTITCEANADTAVDFNVTVLRPANQGFFDVAVNFDSVFCSAKLDCCDDADEDFRCDPAEYIKLLANGAGGRDTTVVLGFACTAGGGDADTTLLMDDIVIDCGADGAAVIDPDGGLGNIYGTAAVNDPEGLLFQVAVYRGEESFTFSKRYWNVAIGVDTVALAGSECTLTTKAGADDASAAGGAQNQHIAAGDVFPFVAFTDIPFWGYFDGTSVLDTFACAQERLDGPESYLQTVYTGTGATVDTCFDHSYPAVTAGGNCDAPPLALTLTCLQYPNVGAAEGEGIWEGGFNEETPPGGTHVVYADATTREIAGFASPLADGDYGIVTGQYCPLHAPADVFQYITGTWLIAVIDTGGANPCGLGAGGLDSFTIIAETNAVESVYPGGPPDYDPPGSPPQCFF